MISVLDFGMGNIHSCLKAVSLFTKDFQLTSNPEDLENSTGIILPGDGAFEKAMSNLNEMGFAEKLKLAYEKKIPIFGICIGFQILFEDSEESTVFGKNILGLGFLKGKVRKFSFENHKVPHMGWNRLLLQKKNTKLLKNVANSSYMYFIHSYRPINSGSDFVSATCSYAGESFPVIVEKDNLFGTQFHPEKSDREGLKILENFIEVTKT